MKVEIKHLAPYLPYGVMVQYKGIINGKEFSKWNKENKGLDVFEEPKTPFPEYKYGEKTGLIKKTETYLDHWKIRVGNGHKNIYPQEFGKDAFLILRPLIDLTKEIEHDEEKLCVIDEINKFHECGIGSDGVVIDGADEYGLMYLPYKVMEILLKHHFDVFGLIEKGLAIDINTLSK